MSSSPLKKKLFTLQLNSIQSLKSGISTIFLKKEEEEMNLFSCQLAFIIVNIFYHHRAIFRKSKST